VVLSETTILVPARTSSDTRANYVSQVIQQYQDALVLLIAAQDQPVIFRGSNNITMGRHQDNETPPTVDLTIYGGHQLGVSRRHATIYPTDTGYTLEDLTSANGTFVNEKRLTPNQPHTLRNGDLVRLGQLLVFVYFSTNRGVPAGQPVEQVLVLVEKEGKITIRQKLTFQRLTRKLMPYLNALAVFQEIINQVMKRPAFDMTLSEINIDKNDEVIRVVLVNYPDALRLLREKVGPWKQQRLAAASSAAPPTEKTTLEAAAPQTPEMNKTVMFAPDNEVPTQAALDMCLDLAKDLVNSIASGLSEDEKTVYVQKLLLPLYTLSVSRFELNGPP
jgi:pSer/pThr/pTyr-binding forkhead associated (FHA) protein